METKTGVIINGIKIKNKKYKTSVLFLFIVTIWSIDFFITALCLNLEIYDGMFYESNIIPAWFFSLGLSGYVLNFIFSITIILIVSVIVTALVNNLKDPDYQSRLWGFIFGLIFGMEGFVIIQNLIQMAGV